jgi:hypothetical protein
LFAKLIIFYFPQKPFFTALLPLLESNHVKISTPSGKPSKNHVKPSKPSIPQLRLENIIIVE